MFKIFQSDDTIRKRYINSQNAFYNSSGHNAVASYNHEVITVTWDLNYSANLLGLSYQELESEIKNNYPTFPDTQEDWALKNILIENKFGWYELCYKTISGETMRAHKTQLV